MTHGVVAPLTELIALQRFAQNQLHQMSSRAPYSGRCRAKARGRGMDFSEARHYQAGDDIRHMDWRITARTGKPHIKLYHEERERPVVILVDFNPSMYFGTRIAFKSVVAARLGALIAWTAAKQGDRVGGLVFSATNHHEYTPRARQAGVLPMLAALSQYTEEHSSGSLHQQNNTTPLSKNAALSNHTGSLNHAMLRLQRIAKPGSTLILISDFYHLDADSEAHFSRLSQHNDVYAYHVCDPLELAPPKPSQYGITDGTHDLCLDTTNAFIREAYQTYCEQRIANLQTQCNQFQIRYVQLTAATDLPSLVQQTLPRRHGG